ncbi:TPA: hypothetical protein ACGPAQ_000558 [Streptococcus suis]
MKPNELFANRIIELSGNKNMSGFMRSVVKDLEKSEEISLFTQVKRAIKNKSLPPIKIIVRFEDLFSDEELIEILETKYNKEDSSNNEEVSEFYSNYIASRPKLKELRRKKRKLKSAAWLAIAMGQGLNVGDEEAEEIG